MAVGGNHKARQFFKQHGWDELGSDKIEAKVRSYLGSEMSPKALYITAQGQVTLARSWRVPSNTFTLTFVLILCLLPAVHFTGSAAVQATAGERSGQVCKVSSCAHFVHIWQKLVKVVKLLSHSVPLCPTPAYMCVMTRLFWLEIADGWT